MIGGEIYRLSGSKSFVKLRSTSSIKPGDLYVRTLNDTLPIERAEHLRTKSSIIYHKVVESSDPSHGVPVFETRLVQSFLIASPQFKYNQRMDEEIKVIKYSFSDLITAVQQSTDKLIQNYGCINIKITAVSEKLVFHADRLETAQEMYARVEKAFTEFKEHEERYFKNVKDLLGRGTSIVTEIDPAIETDSIRVTPQSSVETEIKFNSSADEGF